MHFPSIIVHTLEQFPLQSRGGGYGINEGQFRGGECIKFIGLSRKDMSMGLCPSPAQLCDGNLKMNFPQRIPSCFEKRTSKPALTSARATSRAPRECRLYFQNFLSLCRSDWVEGGSTRDGCPLAHGSQWENTQSLLHVI